jgi:type II secretory pathway predicted ATPase ExeA/tetratricopeptide (TPR) repeat protein
MPDKRYVGTKAPDGHTFTRFGSVPDMYRSHYNLAERPFEISTDTRFLWMGEKHKEALAMLKYGVLARKGFLLLTGDVGIGKTTLVNALLESLSEQTLVANITDPLLEPIDFFNLIAASLGMEERFDNKVDFLLRFGNFLRQASDNNQNVLLILDEAHRLTKDLLEQFRLLSNIELPEKKLINIFFVGQNEFNRTLMSTDCRALRQRITLIHNIKPLSATETYEYINFRLKVAGTEAKILHPKAMKEVYRFSQGYPRLINIICDHALLTGFVKQVKTITPTIVKECSQELCLMGDTIRISPSDFFGHSEMEEPEPVRRPPAGDPKGAAASPSDLADKGIAITEQTGRTQPGVLAGQEAVARPSHEPASPIAKQEPPRWRYWATAASVLVAAAALALSLQKAPFSKARQQGRTTPSSVASEPARDGPETVTLAPSDPLVRVESDGRSFPAEHSPLERAQKELDRGNLDGAERILKDAIAMNSEDLPSLRVLYAATLHRHAGLVWNEDPGKAEQFLTQAVTADPKNAQAYIDLGKLYTASKKYPEAISAYEKAAELDDRSSDIFFNLGFLYATTKDNERAERMFLHVAALRPPYLDKALFNLAAVQCKQEKRQQCVQSLEEALAENPNNQRARTYLSQLKGYAKGSR